MFLFVFMLLTLALPLVSAQAFHCDGHDSIEKGMDILFLFYSVNTAYQIYLKHFC